MIGAEVNVLRSVRSLRDGDYRARDAGSFPDVPGSLRKGNAGSAVCHRQQKRSQSDKETILQSSSICHRARPSSDKLVRSLFKRSDGHGLVIFYVEDGVQLRDLKQIVHFLGQLEQLEFAALVAHRGKGAH